MKRYNVTKRKYSLTSISRTLFLLSYYLLSYLKFLVSKNMFIVYSPTMEIKFEE